MMTTSSTVCSTSLSTWLEIKTVRPWAGVVAQHGTQPGDALGVEAVGRLVEHEHIGLAEQGLGERQALPHAHREAQQPAVRRVF